MNTSTIRRLANLEALYKGCYPLTPAEFGATWSNFDPLSKSVIAAMAEGHFEEVDPSMTALLSVAREYLLSIGEIQEDASTFREIIEELEGSRHE